MRTAKIMFSECENELVYILNVQTNASKSCCLREESRHNAKCRNIVTSSDLVTPWVKHIKYLVSHYLKCSLKRAEPGYYSAVNAILGKVTRVASENVILQLVALKCLQILLLV